MTLISKFVTNLKKNSESKVANKEIRFMGFKSATSRFEMIPESGSNQILVRSRFEDEL